MVDLVDLKREGDGADRVHRKVGEDDPLDEEDVHLEDDNLVQVVDNTDHAEEVVLFHMDHAVDVLSQNRDE